MLVAFQNPLVMLADFIVPPILAYLACQRWGPNRGTLFAVLPALLAVFVLFFFQVSPGTQPDGTTQLGLAIGYMMDDGIFWVASFMAGAAIGSVQWKLRSKRG